MKKILTFVVCLLLCFSGVACNNGGGENGGKKADPIPDSLATIWSVESSVKVLSDKEADYYASSRKDKIRIDAVRNEYENGQVIVSAKEDLTYTVRLTDLVMVGNASKKISKDNFKVYIQKYIFVENIMHGNGAPIGEYPDAIIPQENAVTHGINAVSKGKNGGAWLEYYIPKNAEAGLYAGEAIVSINGYEKAIPVELKVYDIDLKDETTSESLFIINSKCVTELELDNSEEMYEKYIDLLLKGRVTPQSYKTSLDYDYFETAIEYFKKGNSTISLRLRGGVTEDGYKMFRKDVLHDDIVKFAELSLRDNVNYVEKLVFYNAIIDEPFLGSYPDGMIQYHITAFDQLMVKVKETLSLKSEFNNAFGKEVIASVDKIEHVITDYIDTYEHRRKGPLLNADGSMFSYYGKDVVLCPKFDGFHGDEDFDNYRRQADEFGNKIWWYGCNDPNYPYPSYHLEDSLSSAMSIGWMMAEYDIVGNLYWAINSHLDLKGNIIEDPYTTAHRGSGANGEGAIIYPGKVYDVDGPVSSIRFEAIRDGNEDYELLEYLKKAYEDKGENATSLIHALSQSIYNVTSVRGNETDFENTRASMLACLESALDDNFLFITDVVKSDTTESGIGYKVTAKVSDGAELYYKGEKQTLTDNKFTAIINLAEEKNYIDFKAVKGSSENAIKVYLGGKQTSFIVAGLTDDMVGGDLVSSNIKDGFFEATVKYKYNENSNVWRASVIIKNDVFKRISNNSTLVRWYINIPHEKTVDYIIYVNYSKYGKKNLQSGVLSAGLNTIDIVKFPRENLKNSGDILSIEIAFTGNSGTTDTFGIGNMFIYDK